MRADSRGALASVCWHCSMQSGCMAVHEGKQCLFPCDVTIKSTSSFIQINSCNLPYAYCEQIGKEIRDISDEIPFDIPDSWEWARLLSVSYHVGDKSNQILAKEVVPEGIVPVVSQGKVLIDGYSNHLEKAIDLLPLVMFGDHTRNVKYIDFKFVIGADGTKFHKVIIADSKYVYYWMQYVVVNLRDRGYARHYSLLTEQFLPLPPLSEQHRIVSKIEELLPYIEAYEKAETQLTTLNTTFPEMLKKSILQEAVQGKLVPQNPDDEPASVLLERIRAEKQKLIKAGKIKKSKHESVIITRDKIPYEIIDGKERCIADEVPFEIPESWCWCRLSSLATKITDGTHHSPPNTERGEYKYITAKNIKNTGVSLSNITYVSKEIHKEIFSRCNPEYGDVLLIKDGATTGVVTVNNIEEPFSLLSSVALIKCPQYVDSWYLVYVLRSDLFYKNIRSQMKGTGITRVTLKQIEPLFIPMPPLEEQKRIVSQIEKIMPYINTISK